MTQSIPARVAELAASREVGSKVVDFCRFVRYAAIARGIQSQVEAAAVRERAPERVLSVIRAAVDPLSLSSVGTTLSPFQLLANAFLASLSNSAFDQMMPFMMNFPLRTRILAITSTITGVNLPELNFKPISKLDLAANDLQIAKGGGQVIVSEEVARLEPSALPFFENELRTSVAKATDAQFLSLITSGAPSIPSSGSNAIAMRLDLRALLQTITFGAASRLFLIARPAITAAWATVGDASGGPVFPNATYNGGSINGVRVVASDGAPSGTIILADASQIAANQDGVRVDASRNATVQMDSAPDSPATASTPMVSLWQQNLVAALCERFFGAKVCTSTAVATITSASYTGTSP